jgi:serine/threonine protein kinase
VADDTQQLIASRYQLTDRLGRGGMGEVWAAEDTKLGRRVAVKIIDLRRTDDRKRDEIRARALREGRAAAQIDHPNSVRVFDVLDEDDVLYLVMELVDATPLDDLVRRDGPMAPAAAAALGLDVLSALSAAHAAGVVHRDVKPGNVMVLADGRVKLADFGIATITEDPELTATGLVLGTPSYLAPEAASGQRAGAPADLWGLGALLYFAVEGSPPFERDSTIATLHAVVNEPPRPTARAGALAPVLERLLVKDPAARPAAAETHDLLESARRGTDATQVLGPTKVVERPQIARDPAPRPAPRPVPRPSTGGGGRLLAGLAALALLIGIGAVLLQRAQADGNDDASSTTTTPSTQVGAPADAETTETTAPAETTTTTEATTVVDLDRPDGVPADWIPYEGDGWRIWHPATWTARGAGAGQVDLVDAATGQYLRIGSVTPAGDDPVKAWEHQEKDFAKRHPDYERIALEATDYRDYDAAIWEYTFEGQHADNLGFVVGDTGYALNFVTDDGRWDDTSDLRDGFRAGFEPAA